MALFRNKKPDNNVGEAMAELHRAQALAQQSTAQVESQFGMDVQSLMRGATDAMQGGGMEKMMAYRNRAARVTQRGVEMPATLHSIDLGQQSPIVGGVPAQVQLTVEPPGRAPYAVITDQVLHESMAQTLTAGQRVTVKVDPDDQQCLLIWANAEAPVAPAAPVAAQARTERLSKLQELRAAGVLTDAEFEVQQAKLVGE
ncbi:MAG: hypothetical protein DLM57_14265 [Pseudonocardiales bacterium]|nr:MAG: hypothetical protein DLM57_14265 [Pseudonocardiales bacterium]